MSIPSLSLQGKVALVTGGRRGIGSACALVFAEAGADVVVCDWVTKTGELADIARQIRKIGRRSLAIHADVKKKKDVDKVVLKVMDKFGRIDILVNNAGVGDGGFTTEEADYDPEATRLRMSERMALIQQSAQIIHMDTDAWDAVMENNAKSCLLMSQAVAPVMMKQNGGNIINISSVRANARGRGAMANYSVSKRAMLMLTEGLAADLAKYHVRVNAILPGGIITEMMRATWSDPERRKAMGTMMPLAGDLIGPETCGWAALYLASDLSQYVTGQAITVDAGMMVTIPA